MYVQGVSTRKVKVITEELCGHSFSASSITAINKRLDEGLAAFAKLLLPSRFPTSFWMLDMTGFGKLGSSPTKPF
jgi:putative transposase